VFFTLFHLHVLCILSKEKKSSSHAITKFLRRKRKRARKTTEETQLTWVREVGTIFAKKMKWVKKWM
jgi:hypothetical protein